MENTLPCVGLIVLAGCLTFVMAPDEPDPPGSAEAPRTVFFESSLPTVVIDPGHGGADEGARANGLVEKELSLDVGLRLEKVLQERGFPTLMTRRGDSRVGLAQRAAMANQVSHSIFLSIHFNQSPYRSASGVETFYAREKVGLPEKPWSFAGFFNAPEAPSLEEDESLAGWIQAGMVSGMEANNRGISGRALYVVRHVRAPAVLIEGGFLSNAFDAKLLATPEYRQRLAVAIAGGVQEFQQAQPSRPGGPPPQLAKVTP